MYGADVVVGGEEVNGGGGANEDEMSDDGSQAGEKKRRLNVEQVRTLEKNFELGNKLEPERKLQLARALGLQPRQVAIWFQNRRARWKTKQLEKGKGRAEAPARRWPSWTRARWTPGRSTASSDSDELPASRSTPSTRTRSPRLQLHPIVHPFLRYSEALHLHHPR
jgi:hypothetical protein